MYLHEQPLHFIIVVVANTIFLLAKTEMNKSYLQLTHGKANHIEGNQPITTKRSLCVSVLKVDPLHFIMVLLLARICSAKIKKIIFCNLQKIPYNIYQL